MAQRGSWVGAWVGFGVVLGFACGDGEGRKGGAEGVEDAFESLAEFTCECAAGEFGQEYVDICLQEIDDVEEYVPFECIKGVLDRHPEVQAIYDCIADATYDYVDCIMADGCPEQFMCADGSSIGMEWVCDGEQDCEGGEDEPGDCAEQSFMCEDGMTIPNGYRCDGFEDCTGGEDEPADCPETCESRLEAADVDCGQPPEDVLLEIQDCFPTFTCDDGTEYDASVECDGFDDCSGGEDEASCATVPSRLLLKARG